MYKNDHAAMTVSSLDDSREFYADVLGGVVVSKPSRRFLEILLGDVRLHLLPAAGGSGSGAGHNGDPRLDHLCLNVESLAELTALCARLNASPQVAKFGPFTVQESPPLADQAGEHAEQRPPRRTLYFRDPDGLDLEVRCYH